MIAHTRRIYLTVINISSLMHAQWSSLQCVGNKEWHTQHEWIISKPWPGEWKAHRVIPLKYLNEMCACHNKVWLRRRVYFRYKEENIQLNIFKLQILHWKKKPQKPKQKQKNTTKTLSYVCLPMVSWFTLSNRITALYTVLLCFSDALCLGLMICSSVCIVSIL